MKSDLRTFSPANCGTLAMKEKALSKTNPLSGKFKTGKHLGISMPTLISNLLCVNSQLEFQNLNGLYAGFFRLS